jgi:selenocysteine-specific elongation factor
MADAPLTLGTAGHIDHGKTALIRALTGVDTDRLPEERRRGISIALGYAALDLPSGRRLSVVDVPGHERFVRTMVAGATGIDCFLLVVAADDGVMPQTREHWAVLRALGVTDGVVAVTKTDVADPPQLDLDVGGAEVVPVSARTGAGLDELRAALDRVAARVGSRAAHEGPTRLHVDRVFTVRGAGTVVTGTLWSGEAMRNDEVTILPSGHRARVRGVHVHDAPVDTAEAGQRVALNLVGVDRDEVARGDVVVAGDGAPLPTFRVDARLAWRAEPEGPARVMVHHGTREAAARAVALGDDLWQLRLEAPIVPLTGDRLVIRSIAPPDTLGGGVVVDPAPRRHASLDEDAAAAPAVPEPPASPPAAALPELTPDVLLTEERLRSMSPPPDSELDGGTLAVLRAHGRAVRIAANQHFHPEVLADVERRLVALLEAETSVTLARVRDELGSSRRYVQALLEHFDSERLTLRRGDERVLRRRR